MKKISVTIAGRHYTSITLEPEFYEELQRIANLKQISLNHLITQIDSSRTNNNLSSAIRLYILNWLTEQIKELQGKG